MAKKRRLNSSKHPFDTHPFEALCCGSWQSVELIRIRDGTMTIQFVDDQHAIEGSGPSSNLRLRSRRATLSDCTCFLRPGVDICVFLDPKHTESSVKEDLHPVWVDAKISSIERRPHKTHCTCQFYVSLFIDKSPLGSERGIISKETNVVGINQISILQKLEPYPCESEHYRWNFSEDCSVLPRTKLLLGKFSSDLCWLLVSSVLKHTPFDVRSFQNKIIYQIMDEIDDSCLNAISFRVEEDGVSTPIVVQFAPADNGVEGTTSTMAIVGLGPLPSHNSVGLRRSTRRYVQPERFLGCDGFEDDGIPTGTFRTEGWIKQTVYDEEDDDEEEEDMFLPFPYLFGVSEVEEKETSHKTKEVLVYKREKKPREVIIRTVVGEEREASSKTEDLLVWKRKKEQREVIPPTVADEEMEASIKTEDLLVCKRKMEPREVIPLTVAGEEMETSRKTKELVYRRKKKPREATPTVAGEEKEAPCKTNDVFVYKRNNKPREVIVIPTVDTTDKKECQSEFQIVPSMPTEIDPIVFEQYHPHAKGGSGSYSREIGETSSTRYTQRKKNVPDLDDMDIGNKWKGCTASNRKVPRKRYRSRRRGGLSDSQAYQERTLSAGAYNLINSYLKDIDSTMLKKEEPRPLSIPQWKESQAGKRLAQGEESGPCSNEDEGETSETEMLWKEMELAMASAYILEDDEGPNDGELTEMSRKSSEGCKHDCKLDEEIGFICRLCGVVTTEIKDVTPPFLQVHYTSYNTDDKRCDDEEDSEPQVDRDHDDDPETPLTGEHDNVWALVPELHRKLHLHQKKAFEFLWKNITGSLEPEHMKTASKDIGGCVVSHTPGAGKTFLIIAFLVSYLKLFPGKRPLVLAPKSTLYAWYKEFIKWEVPIPVYLIHGSRTFRDFTQRSVSIQGRKPSNYVMHVLDCLEKIYKWHEHPSVLVMGYTSFLRLMRDDSKIQHRKYMARVLRESPGILVLDEGHNPRSTHSRLRKILMQVETELRILLSGTLFQNNFGEYFNTLCLARPKFIDEVLRELDPKSKRKNEKAGKARKLIESRARKFFLDKIAKKIDSSIGEERLQGLNMLRNITSGFIDVYEGGSSDNLPGLQSYTLLMNPTNLQHEILLKLCEIMAACNGYPLELELLITLGSIHPSLVRTTNCACKFFSSEELENLENHKFDYKKGSKVMFVLNLVLRVCADEKVLIFCHNIAPIRLLEELFENVFKWQKGKEVLVLTGDLELFDRGIVMDKFEDPSGPAKILIASITACAEGISLTSASRVVLLDSEWNPSKTKQAIARAFRPGQQKVVYVYQLLATGTLEEDKYRRTTWKEWVSNMIFSEAFVEDPTRSQAEKIEDDILRDIVEVDRVKSIHMIMKNETQSAL